MSDNKNYYYLKLKDNYFDKDNIKILEAMPNGHIYSLIIIKLYLKSCKHDGCLMMTDRIPYDPDKIDILAKVINHDIDHIKEAIRAAVELDLITIFDTGKMWMTEIQNYIGQSSTEADRKRQYRKKLESTELVVKGSKENGQMSGQKTGQSSLELELELEKEKEKEKELKKPKKHTYLDFVKLTKAEYESLCKNYTKRVTEEYISRLNEYIGSKGKRYKSHYFTVLSWMRKDGIKPIESKEKRCRYCKTILKPSGLCAKCNCFPGPEV